MSAKRPRHASRARERDRHGRFVKASKPTPLTAQQVGDLTALRIVEEAPPANILATQAVFTVQADWWQGRPPTKPPRPSRLTLPHWQGARPPQRPNP
jgi:hypothetical protein